MNDPFMTSETIPKTIPRSTLACPPAKNFTDTFNKGPQGQSKTSKNDNSSELISKKESEKKLPQGPIAKSNEKEDQFGGSSSNFKPGKEGMKSTQQMKPGTKISDQVQKPNS